MITVLSIVCVLLACMVAFCAVMAKCMAAYLEECPAHALERMFGERLRGQAVVFDKTGRLDWVGPAFRSSFDRLGLELVLRAAASLWVPDADTRPLSEVAAELAEIARKEPVGSMKLDILSAWADCAEGVSKGIDHG